MSGSRSFLKFLFRGTKADLPAYSCSEQSSLSGQRSCVGDHMEIWNAVRHATMTSQERVVALCDAVSYVIESEVEGDLVECGVWKGGSMMAAAKMLRQHSESDRQCWLYDTFAGMNAPTEMDVDFLGNRAETLLGQSCREQSDSVWCCAGLDEVKANMRTTGFPADLIHYVQGPVEETLGEQGLDNHLPEKISILRLDTDWYESTRIALSKLYPRLQTGGVLIIDDYGHWQGCRTAVDEYFVELGERPFFNRIDYTGRLAIKRTSETKKVSCRAY